MLLLTQDGWNHWCLKLKNSQVLGQYNLSWFRCSNLANSNMQVLQAVFSIYMVSRLSEESLDLQTKIYAGQTAKERVTGHVEISAAASTGAADEDDTNKFPQSVQGPANSVSLHDVFGGAEENKKS